MKKPYNYKKLSEKVVCAKCRKPMKMNLITRNDLADLCYKCWCKSDVNLNRPNGRNPRARKENKLTGKRRTDKIDMRHTSPT